MPEIVLVTLIAASPEVCFDLMRDVRLHTETTASTGDRAVDGVTEGLIGVGQTVTFEGTHFGMRQRLKVRVTAVDPPRLFIDEMVEGRFREFQHIHEFTETGHGTEMRDTVQWSSPFGFVGSAVDRLFIGPHLRRLITKRNTILKEIAENSF